MARKVRGAADSTRRGRAQWCDSMKIWEWFGVGEEGEWMGSGRKDGGDKGELEGLF